ncbi:MAG: ABC transporter ATP-binding protein [Chloroflexota bacterium]|nr:ABC transporter ATP-binding protein [Dehalococcoidia bacterium]MDW8254610.1 ABC transporter ATP-binding protein [Chloroflexota bacterium]
MSTLLSLDGISVHYGPIAALQDVSLEVNEGETVALIGANGAGKTTTLRAATGLAPVTKGRVFFAGQEITGWRPSRIARAGFVHVPQGRGIFADQTVEENLLLGAWSLRDRSKLPALLEREFRRFPRLAERRRQLAGTLSGGEQQMLAISRGLMSEPRCIALDEPSLGLAPLLVREVMDAIRRLNASGVTVLLVEQLATAALEVAHRAYVLQRGRVVLSGTGQELLASPDLVQSYLGVVA